MPSGEAPWLDPIADPLLAFDSLGHPSAPLDRELRARMLFSCLVDADYLDTELYFNGKPRGSVPFDASALADRLSNHVRDLTPEAEDNPVNTVNTARRQVSS